MRVLSVGGDIAARQVVVVVGRFAPFVGHVARAGDELEVGRIVDRLVHDVRELVVDGFQVVAVQLVGILGILLHIVRSGKEDLTSSFCRTEDEGAVVLVFPFAHGKDELGEIGSGKLDAAHLVVALEAHVLHDVGQLDGCLVASGDDVVVHVRLVVFVAILKLDVVRRHIVALEPVVERSVVHLVDGDDTLLTQLFFRARSEQPRPSCQDEPCYPALASYLFQ